MVTVILGEVMYLGKTSAMTVVTLRASVRYRFLRTKVSQIRVHRGELMFLTVVRDVHFALIERKSRSRMSESGVATIHALLLVVAVFLLGT